MEGPWWMWRQFAKRRSANFDECDDAAKYKHTGIGSRLAQLTKQEDFQQKNLEARQSALESLVPHLVRNFVQSYRDEGSHNSQLWLDFDALLAFHHSHGKMITVSAVRPSARFGELEIDGTKVKSFQEKPQLNEGWINGGFFVVEPRFLEMIENDQTILERNPLEKASKMGELMAYRHNGFWQCMDTKRDRDYLETLYRSGKILWLSEKNCL